MLFFNNAFLIFFVVFLPLFFICKGQARLLLILAGSYLFYGWWDYRFLSLLIISTGIDYLVGLRLDKTDAAFKRRMLLLISLIANLGMLGIFKYYNFFAESFTTAFGIPEDERYLIQILLPPGISFYTFQTLSYTIDVYRRQYRAESNFFAFASYVAFFPQLVAGPIERPGKLLPQIKREPRFRFANLYLGSRLFIIGCFKKLVIADNLAPISDAAFSNPSQTTSLGLLIGAYCFAIQIYCDFSGYTDMARGIARAMGINLSINFNLPYLAQSLNDFWRRWHITLSYWLRDYVYIPLGGSRGGFGKHIKNLIITFALSGLWHGASWNFVLWGVLHALWITFELVLARATKVRLPATLKIVITFNVVVLLWILFRAEGIRMAFEYYTYLFSPAVGYASKLDLSALKMLMFYASPLIVFSFWQYHAKSLTPDLRIQRGYLTAVALGVMLFAVILLGAESGQQFIYFQF